MKDTHYRLIIGLITFTALISGKMEAATPGEAAHDSISQAPCNDCSAVARATIENGAVVKKDSARIGFHQSRWNLDENYMENETHLKRMLDHLQKNESTDSALRISSIRVIGAASPEGSVSINEQLSRRRADNIFDYFARQTQLPDSLTQFNFIGRDWGGLQMLVEADMNVPMREEVLNLIASIRDGIKSTGRDSEANLIRLKRLGEGKPYAYMYKVLFPELRFSQLYVEYSYLHPERMRLLDMALTPPDIKADPQGGIIWIEDLFAVSERPCRPFYMGVKTNMLYDALALPNLGVEFYLGKNWSIAGTWTYGWWDRNSSHRYWRAYGGDLTLRRWLGKAASEKPLTGHHLGVYAGVVTYDFEFGGKGYMGGLPGKTLWDRCNYMAGVEYGYSLPVARRLNIDFSIGIGCLWGRQIEYVPEDGAYVWQKTRNFTWVGPTKAEISLVWLIGCDNFNRKFGKSHGVWKGGMR